MISGPRSETLVFALHCPPDNARYWFRSAAGAGEPAGTPVPVRPSVVGDPGSSFKDTQPGTQAQTAAEREEFGVNIYVYPNPATRESLAE